MSKLWKCTVSFDVYVVADDADDAMQTAIDNAEDEFGNRDGNDVVDAVVEIKDRKRLDPEWEHGIPYMADGIDEDEVTCGEFLDLAKATARPADLLGQGKLFGEGV